jgi:lysozyme
MNLIEQLQRDEGDKQFPYTDTVGKLSIGTGRNLTDVGLYPEERLYLLNNDIHRATTALTVNLPWFSTLDAVRQGVLINMCFMGWEKLKEFHNMLAAMGRADWLTAANEMLDSQWARQVGDRAKRLAQQVVSGEWT